MVCLNTLQKTERKYEREMKTKREPNQTKPNQTKPNQTETKLN